MATETKSPQSSRGMLEWQYEKLLGEIQQIELHLAGDCPCILAKLNPPELCLGKHTLNIMTLATETKNMDPLNAKWLEELAGEAYTKHVAVKDFICHTKDELPELEDWARKWRKKHLEPVYYTCSTKKAHVHDIEEIAALMAPAHGGQGKIIGENIPEDVGLSPTPATAELADSSLHPYNGTREENGNANRTIPENAGAISGSESESSKGQGARGTYQSGHDPSGDKGRPSMAEKGVGEHTEGHARPGDSGATSSSIEGSKEEARCWIQRRKRPESNRSSAGGLSDSKAIGVHARISGEDKGARNSGEATGLLQGGLREPRNEDGNRTGRACSSESAGSPQRQEEGLHPSGARLEGHQNPAQVAALHDAKYADLVYSVLEEWHGPPIRREKIRELGHISGNIKDKMLSRALEYLASEGKVIEHPATATTSQLWEANRGKLASPKSGPSVSVSGKCADTLESCVFTIRRRGKPVTVTKKVEQAPVTSCTATTVPGLISKSKHLLAGKGCSATEPAAHVGDRAVARPKLTGGVESSSRLETEALALMPAPIFGPGKAKLAQPPTVSISGKCTTTHCMLRVKGSVEKAIGADADTLKDAIGAVIHHFDNSMRLKDGVGSFRTANMAALDPKRERCILKLKARNEKRGCARPEGDGSKKCPNPWAVCTAAVRKGKVSDSEMTKDQITKRAEINKYFGKAKIGVYFPYRRKDSESPNLVVTINPLGVYQDRIMEKMLKESKLFTEVHYNPMLGNFDCFWKSDKARVSDPELAAVAEALKHVEEAPLSDYDNMAIVQPEAPLSDFGLLAALALVAGGYEGGQQLSERRERREGFEEARRFADSVKKPLLVIGTPKAYANNHPCGDVTIDINPNIASRCPYKIMDARDIKYSDKHFGAAFISHVLEHMPSIDDAVAALNELHRVADKVFVVLPHKSSIAAWLHKEHALWLKPFENGFEIEDRETHNKVIWKPDAPLSDSGERECAYSVCQSKTGKLSRGVSVCGDETNATLPAGPKCPATLHYVAISHNHPSNIPLPSKLDMETSKQQGVPICVMTKAGTRCFRPR